ncbi:class I SAM-dependent methyltransferase [Siphonobacter curvatus]|uniref:class I SAM-dependent methyltransferase n=1 Tax=Siphonobacter curvatus TaxID=2094562 RepID=UPI001FAE81E3|nr:class I SAM-dependent methyltransferase [Siphonobacter curvatus]
MSLITTLTRPEVQAFIQQHQHDDWQKLLLGASRYPDLPIREIAQQIQCGQKARTKLPHWAAQPGVLFPSILSLEQSSSERTAYWKANLMQGDRYADLTGGMGVDFWAASAQFKRATYCEQQTELAELTEYNFTQLGRNEGITWVKGNGMNWLEQSTETFDWLYLDPARRDRSSQKVVQLADCEPNVLEHKDLLLGKAADVLVKVSPMLDIDLAVKQLDCVAHVYVVAVDDEVKELLLHLRNAPQEPEITAVNLLRNGQEQRFSFRRSEEQSHTAPFSQPLTYLYEPNAALLKAGAFKRIAQGGLYKLAPSSHLYTSEALVPDFPGRTFRITAVTKADKKEIRRWVPEGKANLTVRNFPMSVADLRKKLNLSEGGNQYLFATSDQRQNKLILITEKVHATH